MYIEKCWRPEIIICFLVTSSLRSIQSHSYSERQNWKIIHTTEHVSYVHLIR